MSYQTPSSVWNNDFSMENWYRDSIASRQDPESIPCNMLYATQAAFNNDSMALLTASFYYNDFANDDMTMEQGFTTRNKLGLRIDTDKPLPPPPKDPYFDYMFADADLGHQNDEEIQVASLTRGQNIMDLLVTPMGPVDQSCECPSSPDSHPVTPTHLFYDSKFHSFDGTIIEQQTPDTPCFAAQSVIENAESTAFSFLAAGHPNSPNSTTAEFAVDSALDNTEFENTDATVGSYGGYAVKKSPSPYHAPNVVNDAGFGDIRDGCEHVPEQWTHTETRDELVIPFKAKPDTPTEDFELLAPKPLKPLLQAKSRIAKAARTRNMGFGQGTAHRVSYTPRMTVRSGLSVDVLERLNGTKRSACDSVGNFDNVTDAESDSGEEEEEAHSAKRARLSSQHVMDSDAIFAPIPSTFSLFPELKHKKSSTSITNSIFHDVCVMAPTVDGYPGQFRALVPPSKIFHRKFLSGGRPEMVTFGNSIHPNGLFHHTRFQAGGNTEYSEYSVDFSTGAVASIRGPVGKALRLADENLVVAAETERTVEEQNLRRETHFECTLARLEGVSVGEYRYYQGHSSIEEYNQGGMCICWHECFCTNMCSRFADMLCPCKKYIRFEGQEN